MVKLLLNVPMVESPSHKTVLIIDRSPKFAESVPNATVTFSVKDDQNASVVGKLEKKLWSISVEAVMEFHRVVTDLFPRGDKYLRFIISDFVGRFLTPGWSSGSVLSHEQLLNAFATCDLPKAGGDASSCSILNGILLGLEALSEQTMLQRKVVDRMKRSPGRAASCRTNVAEVNRGMNSSAGEKVPLKTAPTAAEEEKQADGTVREQLQKTVEGNCLRIRNRGSMVVITTLDSMAEFDTINEYIGEQIVALNETSRTSAEKNSSVLVDQIHLYVLNIASEPAKMFFKEKHRPNFHSRLISVNAGPPLIVGVHKVLQLIYGLVSTTVCGIPMKEEAQSGQSINYDVELLHPRSAHSALSFLGLLSAESKMMDSATAHENLFTSVRLKWCTASPKLKSDKFPILQRSFSITPAHVSLRQSVCLTSFITNGKSVLLEVFPDIYQGRAELSKLTPNLHQKLISHYLSRDVNGALLLHCVAMGEKANFGGKLVSEYIYGLKGCSAESTDGLNRTAMAQFMQAAQIVPTPNEQFQLVEDDDNYADGEEENGEAEGAENGSVRRWLLGTTTGRNRRRQKGRQNEEQLRSLELLSQGIPFTVNESFIYNVPEKFEPLLSNISRQLMSAEQFAQCKAQIFALVAERGKGPLTEKVFECKLFASGRSDLASGDEHFRVAFDELCRVLSRFSHLSESHRDLLTIFCDLSGTQPQQTQKRKGAFSPSRANAMMPKMAKMDKWEKGEKVNVSEWLRKRYEQEFWGEWKGDFEGRLKYGDKAQEFLYPNLKLPPGQMKYTGTGGAGPIE